MQYQRYELLIGTPTITAMAYGNFEYFTAAGINESGNDHKIAIYPNPSNDKLFLINESSQLPEEFRLFNLDGKLLTDLKINR